MTKDQALTFLSDQGHTSDVEVIDENVSRISFRHSGKHVTLYAWEDDSDYLYLQCSYRIDDAVRDELEVARLVARLEDQYKVIKITVGIDKPGAQGVSAMAQQFLPDCQAFSAIFWRSVDLVLKVADHAWRELNTTVVADTAAERFTEELEIDLHLKAE